jgi:hypothetical protein
MNLCVHWKEIEREENRKALLISAYDEYHEKLDALGYPVRNRLTIKQFENCDIFKNLLEEKL